MALSELLLLHPLSFPMLYFLFHLFQGIFKILIYSLEFYLFIYFLATLGLSCCAWAFSTCSKLCSCHAQASHLRGFSCYGAQTLGQAGFGSCGARAQLYHGMCNLSGPGTEPMSPELAGGLLTTVPPGKSSRYFSLSLLISYFTTWLFSSMLFNLHVFVNFPVFFF